MLSIEKNYASLMTKASKIWYNPKKKEVLKRGKQTELEFYQFT